MEKEKINIGCDNNPVENWINDDKNVIILVAKSTIFQKIFYKSGFITKYRYLEHRHDATIERKLILNINENFSHT